MNKLGMSVCALIAYVLLVLGFGITGSTPATGQAQGQNPGVDVTVVNGPSQPIPVFGDVGLKPESKVGIDPASNGVAIMNGADSPIPVRSVDAARGEPIRIAFKYGTNTYIVPAGKRLILRYISGSATLFADADKGVLPTWEGVIFAISIATPDHADVRAQVNLPGNFLTRSVFGNGTEDSWGISEEVLIFANAGEELSARIFSRRSGNFVFYQPYVYFTGELIDL